MAVKVHYFGSSPNLLGALHLPQRLRARSAAVLLCNPFGEEAARAHRIYRVLATQLERAGYACLRFDLSGTGDSAGDSEDVSISQWLRDLATAAAALQAASGAPRVALVGLRLGATLAALASARGLVRPRHLVLWDPVVSGQSYLRELVEQHHVYLREEMGAAGWDPRRLPRSAAGLPTEVLGAPVPPALAEELAALDLTRDELTTELCTVISTGRGAELEPLQRALGARPTVRWLSMTASAAWNTDAALNAATVPMDIVSSIVARIEETIP